MENMDSFKPVLVVPFAARRVQRDAFCCPPPPTDRGVHSAPGPSIYVVVDAISLHYSAQNIYTFCLHT